jgi:hypothetical protein
MTQPREIEGVLDRWFADGPREFSDRALGQALSQIDHTRQLGAHVVPWRFSEMPTPVRLLLVAALMVASAGAALLVAGATRDQPPDALPSPSPSLQLGEGVLIGSDPQGRWTAARPAAYGSDSGTFRLIVHAPVEFLYAESPTGERVLLGSVNLPSAGVVELGPAGRCSVPGTYTYGVSADTTTLTLATVADECTDRTALLVGDWARETLEWRLQAGTRYRLPMDGLDVDVTIPESFIPPTGGFATYDGALQPVGLGYFRNGTWAIELVTGPRGTLAPVDRCHDGPTRDLPASIDEYLAWNESSSDLVQGEAVTVAVAGRPAVQVDLTGGPDCQADPGSVQPTQLIQGMEVRNWAIDLRGQLLLVTIVDEDPMDPMTPPVLEAGQAFIDSMELTPSR